VQTVWVSKASAKQREGRAGRCLPGYCYHLFSKLRLATLPDFQLPEIKRTPLEELCLQVKLYEPHGRIVDFLLKAMDPPLEISVRNAVTVLQDIGALTSDELLTDIGKQLGSLPVHPSTSRMILLGILLNCLDPALTVACAAGFREPFVLPLHPYQKKQAKEARQELSAMYGGYSDHLSIVAAFDRWEAARASGQEKQYCARYFVSGGTMAQLAAMRKQLQGELAQKGFIPREAHPCSLNAQDPGIVRAVLAAGMYPMVGTLLPPLSGGQKAMVETGRGEKVRIHPQSISIRPDPFSHLNKATLTQLLVVFDEVTRGESQVYIRKCTLVTPYPLLLLSTEMVVAPTETPGVAIRSSSLPDQGSDDEDNSCDEEEEVKDRPSMEEKLEQRLMSTPDAKISIVLDRRLYFNATAVDAAQLFVLRSRLAAALNFKVIHPRSNLPDFLAESVHAIACLLSFDAMPSPVSPSASKHEENSKAVQKQGNR
jgi:ATP-dependent RNA helicase DHX36